MEAQERIRRFTEPSAGLLAIHEQVRKFTEQSSGLLAVEEQIRRFAEPAASGLISLQEQIRNFTQASSPGLLALQEQIRQFTDQSSGLLAIREQMRMLEEPSPAILALREAVSRFAYAAPAIHSFRDEIRNVAERSASLLSTYSEQMRKVTEPPAGLLAFQEQMRLVAEQAASFRTALSAAGLAGHFPFATAVEPLFAERLVALARAQGELDDVLGSSFSVDAVATADRFLDAPPAPAAFIEFLDRLASVIRTYLAAARSISDLAHLYELVTLLLMAATFWYTMYAATTEDIEKLQASVDRQTLAIEGQTDAMRHEFRASRQQFAEKLDELTKSVHELAAKKASTFGPAAVYRVDHAVSVKAERKMKSQTIGWLQLGQAVFVVAWDKKWVQIEYTDLATGTSDTGWVVKKYLKRLR